MANPVYIVLGLQELLSKLYKLEKIVEDESWIFADLVAEGWREKAVEEGAYDTGDFVNAIGWRELSTGMNFRSYAVDTQENPFVDYSGFIEFGTEAMPGRFPAQRSIEALQIQEVWLMWLGLTL